MIRMQSVLSALMIVGLLVMTGCGTWFGTAAADALVPVEQEVELGDQIAEELAEELSFSDDEELTGYVVGLGEDLLEVVDRTHEDLEFSFYLVDDDEMVNAFAIPGGGIYIFTGLIKAMDNEAELAAVMGHEIAHVTRRHIAQRLIAIYGVDAVANAALGEDPGLVGQLVRDVAQQGFMLSYSREQERDADRFGVRYQSAAGYDPEGFITFFQKLEGAPTPPTFLSTHPPAGERIDNIRDHIDELESPGTRTEQERFEQMRDRI